MTLKELHLYIERFSNHNPDIHQPCMGDREKCGWSNSPVSLTRNATMYGVNTAVYSTSNSIIQSHTALNGE